MFRSLALTLCCLVAEAQPQTPLASVSSNFVEVHVVAQDKRGEPVTGLAAPDFQVFDNGVEEKIAVFAVDAARQIETPASRPDVVSNRLSFQTGQANATAILIGGLNTESYDQAEVRKQLIALVEEIRPEERIAIFLLGTRLLILQDLTTDSRKLLAAVRNFEGQAPGELSLSQRVPDRVTQNNRDTIQDPEYTPPPFPKQKVTPLDAVFKEFIESARRRPNDFSTERRIRLTTEALTAIAHYLAGIPGHKSLIWLTSSLPLEIGYEDVLDSGRPARETSRSYGREIREAMRLISDCNVAIYAVDARGLAPARGMNAEAGGGFRLRSESGGAVLFSPAPRFIDTLQTISDQTGGRAFYGTNDLKQAIHSAMNDAAASYTLGFYSHSVSKNRAFHTIKVTTSRAGTRLRYRSGFYDHGDFSPGNQNRPEEQLNAALVSPVDATGIPIDVRIRPASAKAGALDLAIRVDTAGISIEEQDQRWKGRLDVIAAERDDKGTVVHTEAQAVDLNLTRKAFDTITRDHAVVLFKTLSPGSTSSAVRILVRDRTTGRIGSVTYSVEQR